MSMNELIRIEGERCASELRERGLTGVRFASLASTLADLPVAHVTRKPERFVQEKHAHGRDVSAPGLGDLLRHNLGRGESTIDSAQEERWAARKAALRDARRAQWERVGDRLGVVTVTQPHEGLVVRSPDLQTRARAPSWYGVIVAPTEGFASGNHDEVAGLFTARGLDHFLLFIETARLTPGGFLDGWSYSMSYFDHGHIFGVPLEDRGWALPWPAA